MSFLWAFASILRYNLLELPGATGLAPLSVVDRSGGEPGGWGVGTPTPVLALAAGSRAGRPLLQMASNRASRVRG